MFGMVQFVDDGLLVSWGLLGDDLNFPIADNPLRVIHRLRYGRNYNGAR